jgi:hypothetical protein
MIRRAAGNHLLLITQHDHALLSGQCARHLAIPAPSPFDATLEAIAHHDCGWPIHDDQPTLNPAGLPLHVFESPPSLSTQVWSASVTRAMNLGDYQGLLVSLHVLALSALYLKHAKNPSRADLFEINKFQHRQIEIQEDLRQRLHLRTDVPLQLGLARPGASAADDQLLFNFRMLTAMDRLSLTLCCGELLFATIDDLLPQPGQLPIQLTLTMPDSATLTIDPWLFDQPAMTFQVPARRVDHTPFSSLENFRRAYHAAVSEPLNLRLIPAPPIPGRSPA